MKPTKKQIESMAAKLREVFRAVRGLNVDPWKELDDYNKKAWRALAKYIMSEDFKPSAATMRTAPKSCKVVRGKQVCK